MFPIFPKKIRAALAVRPARREFGQSVDITSVATINDSQRAGTFRRLGKTDIRIEEKARAAFVVECKMVNFHFTN